jgi:hypothetical protein
MTFLYFSVDGNFRHYLIDVVDNFFSIAGKGKSFSSPKALVQ